MSRFCIDWLDISNLFCCADGHIESWMRRQVPMRLCGNEALSLPTPEL